MMALHSLGFVVSMGLLLLIIAVMQGGRPL